jgi:hypothetical protein
MKTSQATFAALLLCASYASGSETLTTAIHGDTLLVNGNEMKLGAGHWAEPEKSWRTVGELVKSALPPADSNGKRDATLSVELDSKASWGALKTLMIATANLGVPRASVTLPTNPKSTVKLSMPGAEASGDVATLPLLPGDGDDVLTENDGNKMKCTSALVAGMVKQLPKATIEVTAPLSLPAHKVVRVLNFLNENKAAAVSYLPFKAPTEEDAKNRKEAKDAVDGALRGVMGNMGK